jgi:hypothetical protein
MRNEMPHQRAAIKRSEDVAAIETFILERFIETGNDLDVREIATGTALSEDRVRRALREISRARFCWTEETRPSYSRDYPTMEWRTVKVGTWGPRRTFLAAKLRELRDERGKVEAR